MSISDFDNRIELKSPGISHFLILSIVIAGLLGVFLYIAVTMGSMVFYIMIPFIVLAGLYLVFLVPYRIYYLLKYPIDVIVFDSNGLTISNKKLDILKHTPWEMITEVFVNNKDADENPEEIAVLTKDDVEIINLKLYDSLTISKKDLWNKIAVIYEKGKKIND